MLYTTYLSNMGNILNGAIKIFVAQYIPKSILNANIVQIKDFAPNPNLLKAYKTNVIDWDKFEKNFRTQLDNPMVEDKLNYILKLLKENKDICFICYEKDNKYCHRRILAEWFFEKGIEWREL